jgi:hypothetical protein
LLHDIRDFLCAVFYLSFNLPQDFRVLGFVLERAPVIAFAGLNAGACT